MQSPPRDQVEAALADLIREALSRGESVHVDGFGTFSTRHRSSTMSRNEDGTLKMRPPGSEIVFTLEK